GSETGEWARFATGIDKQECRASCCRSDDRTKVPSDGFGQRLGGSMVVEQDTRLRILAAAKGVLLDVGYAKLSTRGIAEAAGVPLSQIHYHFRSKQNLMLAVLDMENRTRLARQAEMYEADKPLWEQWLQACDFFDDDLESGYVRVLMEMTAAGWSDQEIAEAGSAQVQGWVDLLADVAQRAAKRLGPPR